MPDMHGAGRVDAHELDLHALARARVDVAERRPRIADGPRLLAQPAGAQPEIDEPRRRGVDLAYRPVRAVNGDGLRQERGDLHRRAARGLGDAQRQAGREVAMLRLLRTLRQPGGGNIERRKRPVALRLSGGLAQAVGYEIADEHRRPIIALARDWRGRANSLPPVGSRLRGNDVATGIKGDRARCAPSWRNAADWIPAYAGMTKSRERAGRHFVPGTGSFRVIIGLFCPCPPCFPAFLGGPF